MKTHELVFPVVEVGVAAVACRGQGMVPEDERERSVTMGVQLASDKGEFAAVQAGMIAIRARTC